MVGESIFMDRLVLRTIRRTSAKLVLYNGEAYRIIDLNKRKGIERAYYRKVEELYQILNRNASLVIFNCEPLMAGCSAYRAHSQLVISYFGNLGVGRVDSLIQVANVLYDIDRNLVINIYGNATNVDKIKFEQRTNIRYHGFVSPQSLQCVLEKSDILIHVESFDKETFSKLRYAFSTKLAQYLCAGRPLLCYAPKDCTSAEYLKQENGAVVATNVSELTNGLKKLIEDPEFRAGYAVRARQLGIKNHDQKATALLVKQEIEFL